MHQEASRICFSVQMPRSLLEGGAPGTRRHVVSTLINQLIFIYIHLYLAQFFCQFENYINIFMYTNWFLYFCCVSNANWCYYVRYCPKCQKHRQASKKLDLWRLPDILVIHLKRFSYSRFLKSKLETYVDFPIDDLDLSTYISHKDSQLSHRYVLYATSNHYGGMGGGHYTAFVDVSNVNSLLYSSDCM